MMSKGLFASLYDTGQPFALIDTRERRDHVDGHWFGSTNIPLSVLTAEVARLIPDHAFPIHLLNWGDHPSQVAANRLAALGYRNVTVCPTTRPDQYGDGFVRGEFVWSKAFGEVVAHGSGLPEVTPAEYLEHHQDALLFDVRPTAEYTQFTLPGSQSLPNSLMLANMAALKDIGETALLHCAGRTRSIIGACTLRAAGYDGPFAIFKGGTQAWQLDGHQREHGAQRIFAQDTGDQRPVQKLLDRWNIRYRQVARDDLAAFVRDHRQAHLCDVSDDAATGHMAYLGIIKISGTNLIQQTDRTIARYHVPVILFDRGSGSRAAFAAYWLKAMGFQVSVVYLDHLLPAADTKPRESMKTSVDILSPDQMKSYLGQGGAVYDVRPSRDFCAGHLQGSQWQNISALLADPGTLHADQSEIAVVGTMLSHAVEAAEMLAQFGYRIKGAHAWDVEAWQPSEVAATTISLPPDESALFAGRHHGNMQDSRDYLAWEEDLPEQIDQSVHRLWLRRLGA